MDSAYNLYFVDDNPDYHFLVYRAFKQLDIKYQVKFFENGKMLRQHLNFLISEDKTDQLPGLIIVDLNMPGMNGMELLNSLKVEGPQYHEPLSRIPVVVMSHQTNPERIRQCYRNGANAYLVKPTEFEGLKHILTKICSFWMTGKGPGTD